MTEERRHIIEEAYIHCGALGEVDDIIKLPKSLKKERAVEFKKKHNVVHDYHQMGKHGANDFAVAPYGFGYVDANLRMSIYFCQTSLDRARASAKKALEYYLEDKRKLKEHIIDWNTENVRSIYNFHKSEWIKASNEVKLQKRALWYAQLMYSRFNEWYTATNDRIKELETLLSKQEK